MYGILRWLLAGKIAKLNCFSLAKTLKIILPLYICKDSCLAGDRMKGDGRHERIYLQKL